MEGENILFKYNNIQSFDVILKDGFKNGVMNKVAYIPSERNILSMPNISTFQMENNYIRSFMFDWLGMRSKYNSSHSYPILNLGVNYYYDEKRGDIIRLVDGNELALSEASSGLQALIPMLVYINYVTKWIYENDADISYDKYTSLQKALLKDVFKENEAEFNLDEALKIPEVRANINSLLKRISKLSETKSSDGNAVTELIERIGKPHSTKLTIEEGEMNIFPSTQYELVKAVIGAMNFERGDTLLLTTHSPYIMTSLNNLIQSGNSFRENPEMASTIDAVIPQACWLNYSDVNAWKVDDGIITSIKDDEYQLIASDALDEASERISGDFSKLIEE